MVWMVSKKSIMCVLFERERERERDVCVCVCVCVCGFEFLKLVEIVFLREREKINVMM